MPPTKTAPPASGTAARGNDENPEAQQKPTAQTAPLILSRKPPGETTPTPRHKGAFPRSISATTRPPPAQKHPPANRPGTSRSKPPRKAPDGRQNRAREKR